MKRLLKVLLVLLFMFSFTRVFADNLTERLDTTNGAYNDGSSRKELDNYGVKKKWNINNSNIPNVLRTPLVDASIKVYDYAEILTEEDEKEIRSMIAGYIEKTNFDLVFVTINMPYTVDDANEIYAADFYDYNDFGIDFKNYSGILLLRNAYPEDRYYNIYTFGDAQLYYIDYRGENILDDIWDDFRSDRYVDGFRTFVDDLNRYYNSGVISEDIYIDDNGYIQYIEPPFTPPVATMGIIAAITDLIVVGSMKKKNKMVKPAYNASSYIDKSTIKYNVKRDEFLTTHTIRHFRSSDSSSGGGGGGGGFHSSGGSSGGGHSSGGGRHG